MKKRIFTLFLVILMLVTNMSVSYASALDSIANINIGNYQGTLDRDLTNGRNVSNNIDPNSIAGSEDNATGIIKVIVNIMTWIPKVICNLLLWIIQLFLPTMDVIIFNEGASIWSSYLQLTYFDSNVGLELAGNLRGYVSSFYQVFRYVALIGFIVAIACIAVKMIVSSIGKQKQQYKEQLKNWMIGIILLVVGHWIMIYAIYFSDWLVELIVQIKNSMLSDYGALFTWEGGGEAQTLMGAFSNALGSAFSGGYLTLIPALQWLGLINSVISIIAILVFTGMNLKIFKVYLERVVVVGVLIMLFPLVTIFYAFEKGGIKKGSTFESWLRTFIDQVFIQPVHAVSLLFVILVLNAIAGTPILQIPIIGMVVVLMVMNLVFPIENIVKRVFAINGAALGSPINPMGAVMSGLGMAAPMARQQALSYKQARKDGKGYVKSMLGATKDAIKFGATGKNGVKNAKALSSLLGVSLPDEIFDIDKLTQKEQKDATKRLRKAAATKDLELVAGQSLHTDIRNLEHMMDSKIVADIRRKLGIDNKLLEKVALNGEGNISEQVAVRKYMQMLADPTVDVSNMKAEQFDQYTSSDDEQLLDDLKGARDLSDANKRQKAAKARKVHEYKHPDESENLRKKYHLESDAKIEAIENGSTTYIDDQGNTQIITDDDKLEYQVMIERMRNSKLSHDDFTDKNGDLSAIEYKAKIMKPNARVADTIAMSKAATIDKTKARELLASHRKVNEDKFYEDVGKNGIATSIIDNFIDGNGTIDENQLRSLFGTLAGKKSNLDVMQSRTLMEQMVNDYNIGWSDPIFIEAFNEYSNAYPDVCTNAINAVNAELGGGQQIDKQYINEVLNGTRPAMSVADKENVRMVIARMLGRDLGGY